MRGPGEEYAEEPISGSAQNKKNPSGRLARQLRTAYLPLPIPLAIVIFQTKCNFRRQPRLLNLRAEGASLLPPIINAQSISKAFGAKPLFENVSFVLSEAARIGLIPARENPTLLRILAGTEQPDSGDVTVRKRDMLSRNGYAAKLIFSRPSTF